MAHDRDLIVAGCQPDSRIVHGSPSCENRARMVAGYARRHRHAVEHQAGLDTPQCDPFLLFFGKALRNPLNHSAQQSAIFGLKAPHPATVTRLAHELRRRADRLVRPDAVFRRPLGPLAPYLVCDAIRVLEDTPQPPRPDMLSGYPRLAAEDTETAAFLGAHRAVRKW